MRHDTLDLNELIHYAELGEIPGLHPTVAKDIREKIDRGQSLHESEPTRQELKDEIASLEETMSEISALAS